jgi:hypothetical protein
MSLAVAGLIAGGLMLSSLHGQQAGLAPNPSGTWIQTITLKGEAPFQGLVTFNADGTVTDTDQADAAPPDIASPGHGVWLYGGQNTVHIRLEKFLFLAGGSGTPDGTNLSIGTVTIKDSDNFQANGVVEVFSNTGQQVLTIPFTSVGKRMTLSN